MVEPGTVRRLLEEIESRLTRLEAFSAMPVETYRLDRDVQDIVERNLEVLIQACIDLGLHVLADLPAPLPDTNRGVFASLRAQELLDQDLSERLQLMAGFRNVLVHGYADLVPEKVHGALTSLDDVRAFVRDLTPRLTRASQQN